MNPDASQPMATVACVYCTTTLSYPQNSLYIQCPKCQNTMNPAAPHASYVNCCGCNTLLSHPPTSLTIQCPKCLMVMDLPSRGPNGNMITPGIPDAQAGRKSRKKRKDPNAPKRATNAYMIFCRERRSSLKDERPDLQFGKLGAKLGEMWRLMSAEEKKPYEQRATGDRDRYKSEMGSYQSANMLKGNAMNQLGLTDDSAYQQHTKKTKLEDGSALGIDYSTLDPAHLEIFQAQQQQYLAQLQQQQQLAAMQQAQQSVAQSQGALDTTTAEQQQQYQQQEAAKAATKDEADEGEEEE